MARRARPVSAGAFPVLDQTGSEDCEEAQKALGTRDDVTLTSFPELNHLMMAAPVTTSADPGTEGLSGPEEYEVAGHVDEAVIDAIASHILG